MDHVAVVMYYSSPLPCPYPYARTHFDAVMCHADCVLGYHHTKNNLAHTGME